MKAINKIIILGMAVALFNSCDLTLLPENAVTQRITFKTNPIWNYGPINFIPYWTSQMLQPVQMQMI